jgi:hypothetical protein
MILHAIELNYVGPLRSRVRIGPFTSGLNIFAAPNESGKSTCIRAAARALFDRHTTKGDEIKSLQPAGTDLAPQIAVEFETGVGRFRIEKTFLQGPRSFLKQWQSGAWQLISDSDAADQRVQALLQSSLPGKGATKPEHWGFLGFLWARQGEPSEWPSLDDAAVGQRIRARLARVEIDPVIEKLSARLAGASDIVFTSTGLAKANGPLDAADKDLAAIESALAVLRQTRAELDSAHERYRKAETAVAQLEKEHGENERTATALREQTLNAERLRIELDALKQSLASAQERLTAVAHDADTLAQHNASATAAKAVLAQAEDAIRTAEQQLRELRAHLDSRQAERPEKESELNAARTELDRLGSLIKLRQYSSDEAALARQLAKAETAAGEVASLETKKIGLPALTAAKLRKIEEQDELVRTIRAQLQVLGLTVDLTPENDSSAVVQDGSAQRDLPLPAKKAVRLHSPQTLDLQLAGWGRVVIRSGAKEAQDTVDQLGQEEAALRDTLGDVGVNSVEAARDAFAARKEIESQLKAANATLVTSLGDFEDIAGLREAAAKASRRASVLAAALGPTEDDKTRSNTDLDAAEARLAKAVPAAEKTLAAFDKVLDQLRAQEREAVKALQLTTQGANEHRTRLHTLGTQISDLTGRYPQGVDAAKAEAQVAFVQAEARVKATEGNLPPDFGKLPDRNRRAAAALQQIVSDLQASRTERDEAKGKLETLGGQGIYSRETDLEEEKSVATLRRDAARAKGWCARIAHDLIERRKQAATQAVLTPLEQRLTTAFAELTDAGTRQVFLDANLQIAGIGRTREEVYAFESLSQGAKEQLLLCLRIAVAQELANDEPQVVILDDVLANTDSARHERVLDVLASLSTQLQIVVLTCHPEKYRGVGSPITLKPVA